LNIANESALGNKKGFTMLFEMNTLYEQYIGKLVKELWNGDGKITILQDNSKYLLVDAKTKKNKLNLIPDILLKENSVNKLIIDTKWKAVEYDNKVLCTTEDLYQMHAYITTYTEVNRVVLLYPCLIAGNEYPTWELTSYRDKLIEVRTVRLDEYRNTIEDLKKIFLGN
jgi:5-methylcytosine-specific restriction enzyme subunit McrC